MSGIVITDAGDCTQLTWSSMVEGISLCFVLQLLLPAAAASPADRVMVVVGCNAVNVLVQGTTLLVSKKTRNRPAAALLLVCDTTHRLIDTTIFPTSATHQRQQEPHSSHW